MSLDCPKCGSANTQAHKTCVKCSFQWMESARVKVENLTPQVVYSDIEKSLMKVGCLEPVQVAGTVRTPEGKLWDAGRLTYNPDLAARFESSIDAHEWAQLNDVPMGLLEVHFIAKGQGSVYLSHYKMVWPKCNLADGKRVYYK